METIEVKLVKLNDGRVALQYPKTPEIYNLEGYYFLPRDSGSDFKVKMTAEQVDLLVPKA